MEEIPISVKDCKGCEELNSYGWCYVHEIHIRKDEEI